MVWKRSLVVFAFLWAAAVRADPPSLSVPPQIAGQPGAFLSVTAATSCKNVKWFVLDPGLSLFPTSQQKDSRTATVLSIKEGTYRLAALTASGDELSEPAICTVVIQGQTPAPAPAPQPSPAPAPPPQPAAKASWAVVILDNTKRTPAIGQLLSSPSLFASLQHSGVNLRVLDVNDPLVIANNYASAVNSAGGAPTLLVLSAKGRRLRAVPLPADEAAVLAAVGAAAITFPACGPNGCPAR